MLDGQCDGVVFEPLLMHLNEQTDNEHDMARPNHMLLMNGYLSAKP